MEDACAKDDSQHYLVCVRALICIADLTECAFIFVYTLATTTILNAQNPLLYQGINLSK